MKKEAEVDRALVANSENIRDYILLLLAVQNGDLVMVEKVLKNCVYVNDIKILIFGDELTLLRIAVENANEEMFLLLLRYGADVNAKTSTNLTLLHICTRKYNIRIIELLLNHGACIDSFALEEGYTPLHIASEEGNFDVVELFLSKGADINVASAKNGLTPLHCATKLGKHKIVSLLLQRGAQVDKRDKNGKTVLNYAVEKDDLMMTKLLLNGGAKVTGNYKLLHEAIKNESIEIVKTLLEWNVDINACDRDGISALHLCSKYGLRYGTYENTINILAIVKLLLSKGVNIDAQDKYGETALHKAVEEADIELIDVLLEHNANVHCYSNKGWTPLQISVYFEYEKITKLILNRGVDVNAKDKNGCTTLHYATRMGSKDMVKLLLEHGAQVDSKLNNGRSSLHLAAKSDYNKIIEILLKFGADIDSRNDEGDTALHIASLKGRIKAAEILVEHGSDLNIVNENNKTPLECATDRLNELDSSDSEDSTEFEDDDIIDFRGRDERVRMRLKAVIKLLQRHIIKMKTESLYVNENNILLMSSSADLTNYQHECEIELACMRSETISNSNISYYNILTKTPNSLAICMRNVNVVQILTADEYLTKFPIYSSMIKSQIEKGMVRKKLIEQSINIFRIAFHKMPELPHVCTEKILNYLNEGELRNLVDICSHVEMDRREIKYIPPTKIFKET